MEKENFKNFSNHIMLVANRKISMIFLDLPKKLKCFLDNLDKNFTKEVQ